MLLDVELQADLEIRSLFVSVCLFPLNFLNEVLKCSGNILKTLLNLFDFLA